MLERISPRMMSAHRRGGVIQGCLIALGVLLLLAIIGGVIVAMNWRSWTASGMRTAVTEAVQKSTLPPAEQAEVIAVVDQFADDFKDGSVTASQFFDVLTGFSESPMVPAMIVSGMQSEYVDKSTLTPEEKADGNKQLSRFVHGVYDKSIPQTKIDDVAAPISAPAGATNAVKIHTNNVNIELKDPEDVTPEELKAFLANAKAAADEANVPDQMFQIDWSNELQKVIDEALGRTPTEAATPPDETTPDTTTPPPGGNP